MGMSIDDAIEKYKNQAEWEHSHNNTDYYEEYEQIAEWLEKLQKIEQIIKDHDNDRISEDYWYIDKIREVIENGMHT